MSKKMRFLFFVLAVSFVCLCAVACAQKSDGDTNAYTDTQSTETEITYENVNVDDYVKAIQYKNLSVAWNSNKDTKETAVWDAVYATVTIENYPEKKVSYYFDQMKDAYMHYAKGNEADYLLILEAQGTSEEEMLAKSRQMVKEDLVYEYIVRHEQITVTDEEKNSLFVKYVQKYSAELNKSPEYVKEQMAEYIYESMLYDKTTEYLFSVNTFVTDQ